MQRIDAPKSLPELVYDAVLNAVCEGTLRPGERVTQEAPAQRLDVSRLPVGQALKRLEADGFLLPSGRRGLQVAPLTPASATASPEPSARAWWTAAPWRR